MVLLSPWLIKLIYTRMAFGSVDDPDKCFMTNTSVGALKVCKGTRTEEGAALGGGVFWGFRSEAFSAPLAHLSFFRPRGADAIARGTQTHTRLNTFSWLCLAMLPACGLLDLPLCCHYLIAALVQHGAMFMWPGFRPPNVPPNSNCWSHALKKNPKTL